MVFQQRVQAPDLIDLVFRAAPVERRGVVDQDLLAGEPFHAVGEGKAPVLGKECAERRPHRGPDRRPGRQAVVVMGFGEMDQKAVALMDVPGPGQIVLDLTAVVILKELGIGPVEVGPVQKIPGHGDLSAEALQKENRVRILLPHPGDHERPGGHGDHVPGIAAEPVNAPPAPGEKHVGHVNP